MSVDISCSHLEYDMELFVRYGEIGYGGLATLASVGNWLQESAGLSADALGFGEKHLLPFGKTWILTRLILHINRLPEAREYLRVHTWPSVLGHTASRGYEVYDAKGACIITGGSSWVVMDIHSRNLTVIPADLIRRYPEHPRPCEKFTCRVIPRITEGSASCRLIVRRDDLDINGHVNNTRYLAWIMETLPQSFFNRAENKAPVIPRILDITFRSECFPQEELKGFFAPIEPFAGLHPDLAAQKNCFPVLHSIQRASGAGDEVCRALTFWDSSLE